MSTDGMMEVEVPIFGTSVVEDGDVHEAEASRTDYVACWCTNGKHVLRERTRAGSTIPHLAAVTTVKYTWTPPEKVNTVPRTKKPRNQGLQSLAVSVDQIVDEIGRIPK